MVRCNLTDEDLRFGDVRLFTDPDTAAGMAEELCHLRMRVRDLSTIECNCAKQLAAVSGSNLRLEKELYELRAGLRSAKGAKVPDVGTDQGIGEFIRGKHREFADQPAAPNEPTQLGSRRPVQLSVTGSNGGNVETNFVSGFSDGNNSWHAVRGNKSDERKQEIGLMLDGVTARTEIGRLNKDLKELFDVNEALRTRIGELDASAIKLIKMNDELRSKQLSASLAKEAVVREMQRLKGIIETMESNTSIARATFPSFEEVLATRDGELSAANAEIARIRRLLNESIEVATMESLLQHAEIAELKARIDLLVNSDAER